jgi:uncharacterized protein YdhG (YjbR/CyaY superfamily)
VTGSSEVEGYLAQLPAEQHAALDRLRAHLRGLLPEAVEAISYGMPTFKIGDRAVVWYAGWKAHCSIYPLTDSFLRTHADAPKGFGRTKGSLHFRPEAPIPEALVEELVRARLSDLEREGT